MASLKEVKTRIASVGSTRKITSAMKMVASSKLHRAQQDILNMRPYQEQLGRMLCRFLAASKGDVESPLADVRPAHRVVLIAISSNTSLCGGFNLNVAKQLRERIDHYRHADGATELQVLPIGAKIHDAAAKMGVPILEGDYATLLDHPAYAGAARLARELMARFTEKDIDKVEIIGHHFKTTSTQVLEVKTLLPVSMKAGEQGGEQSDSVDYIVEPSSREVLEALLPKAVSLQLFTALLDSLASEHAARVIAMQVATDNADELLRQLTLTYNKTRQQAITTELLDIVGGSMA